MAKPSIEVDKSALVAVINKLEKGGPLPNLNSLVKATSEEYNKKSKVSISPSVVMLRIKEWELPIKTKKGKRGRAIGSVGLKPSIKVDKESLLKAFKKAENHGPLASLSHLWKAVAKIYNETADVQISPAIVLLRAKEWNVEYQTQAGKKGRESNVNKDLLLKAFADAEMRGPLKSLSHLWERVAELYNDNNVKSITPAIAANRAEKWELEIKTQNARAGNDDNESKPTHAALNEAFGVGKPDIVLAGGREGSIIICTPRCYCPIKLEDTDRDSVLAWSEDLLEHGFKNNHRYTLGALTYFVRHFYDMFTEEYNVVVQNLKDLYEPSAMAL